MNNLTFNYIPASEENRNTHMWTAVGENGGVHIWAAPQPQLEGRYWPEKFFGGVEIHSKVRLYEFGDGKPSHDNCWLLGCPCHHDGSSLYFSERIEPLIRHEPQPFADHIHEYMNAILFDWYRDRFEKEAAE